MFCIFNNEGLTSMVDTDGGDTSLPMTATSGLHFAQTDSASAVQEFNKNGELWNGVRSTNDVQKCFDRSSRSSNSYSIIERSNILFQILEDHSSSHFEQTVSFSCFDLWSTDNGNNFRDMANTAKLWHLQLGYTLNVGQIKRNIANCKLGKGSHKQTGCAVSSSSIPGSCTLAARRIR